MSKKLKKIKDDWKTIFCWNCGKATDFKNGQCQKCKNSYTDLTHADIK